ncbi:Ig-like domain-containing protein [Gemmata sp.]|uniref:Ig-like domain-containing protein n=1 Tax=Gemmata sp. TaxID=1914242 RepID=UPI003F70AA80
MRHAACLALAFAAQVVHAADSPAVALSTAKGEPPVIEVRGLPKELVSRLKDADAKGRAAVLRVVVGGGTIEEQLARTPLAGSYSFTDTGVRFEPQFPLVPGREYVAILRDDPKAAPALTTLSLPKPPPGPRVSVAAVYPSANRLPENTLRFYVQFSGPVARGDVYRHVTLVRDDGVEVKEPFLELPEELWSADGDRLTLLFHPGRVKQGLVPREDDGPVLGAGRTYSLMVSGKWEDTEGRPLLGGAKKTFAVGPPDDQPLDAAAWALMAPRAGGDSPLIVKFPKPLDRAMLDRVVWVVDAAGTRVDGEVTVGGGERVLTFAPKKPWGKGEYRLVADARLEDPCGNRVGEAFELTDGTPLAERPRRKPTERAFTVR